MTAHYPASQNDRRTRELLEDGAPVVGLAGVTRTRSKYERFAKRPMDFVFAAGILVVLSPILVLSVAGLRAFLGPDVVLSQVRVGRNGKTFRMLKLRTMHLDRRRASMDFDGDDRRQTHKSTADPRHTSVGRLLRSLSVDEIPQLINVLKGEMSLVGPRPELYEVAKANGILDHPRHLVRPGLTGLFQTSGLRSKVDLSEGLHLDMAYVINLSFTSDLKILIRTTGALVRRTGA
jgi:lipopolysaccharide/colanic/teichoic acid biosynthesis glycosyltransferase